MWVNAPLRAPLPASNYFNSTRSQPACKNGNLQEVLDARVAQMHILRSPVYLNTWLALLGELAGERGPVPWKQSCSVCWEILMACSGARREKIKKKTCSAINDGAFTCALICIADAVTMSSLNEIYNVKAWCNSILFGNHSVLWCNSDLQLYVRGCSLHKQSIV